MSWWVDLGMSGCMNAKVREWMGTWVDQGRGKSARMDEVMASSLDGWMSVWLVGQQVNERMDGWASG